MPRTKGSEWGDVRSRAEDSRRLDVIAPSARLEWFIINGQSDSDDLPLRPRLLNEEMEPPPSLSGLGLTSSLETDFWRAPAGWATTPPGYSLVLFPPLTKRVVEASTKLTRTHGMTYRRAGVLTRLFRRNRKTALPLLVALAPGWTFVSLSISLRLTALYR